MTKQKHQARAKIEVYQNSYQRWQWMITYPNGIVVGRSTSSYATKKNAQTNIQAVLRALQDYNLNEGR